MNINDFEKKCNTLYWTRAARAEKALIDKVITEKGKVIIEMTFEEKKEILLRFGLSETLADHYLQYDTDTRAVVPAFRLLKPLNDHLGFYKGEFKKLIEKQVEDGTLEKQMPVISEMLQSEISPELIEAFAYELTLQAYDGLLYQLDDHEGAEIDNVFQIEPIGKCGYGRLMEMRSDGVPTGRFLIEVHGKVPFSNL